MRSHRRRIAATVIGAVGAMFALVAYHPVASSETQKVPAQLDEYSIKLDQQSAKTGKVTFRIRNTGKKIHEFVIIQTDRAANALPKKSKDRISEDGTVAEAPDIKPGKSATLHANLKAGRYVVVCNLPGHYKGGMRASFRVR
jgi:uncharacterized cupredoxin-like copper-binding protein